MRKQKSKQDIINQFIKKAEKKHKLFYNYDLVTEDKKVKIICPLHGKFIQSRAEHLYGKGCPKCAIEKRRLKNAHTKELFIDKARLIHGNKFDYSKVKYINNRTKVIIICPIHGDFEVTPSNHLKRNCPKCGKEAMKSNSKGFYNKTRALRGDFNFEGWLYLYQLSNDKEAFIKVGVSKNPKRRRQDYKEKGFTIKVILEKQLDSMNEAVLLETDIKELKNLTKYLPKTNFQGKYECFDSDCIDSIIERLKINDL